MQRILYFIVAILIENESPCTPSPCGANAICKEQSGAGSCTCLSDYIGNPYEGCRPECTVNSDCVSNMACIRSKCQDPCPGTCGQNAICQVINHSPACTCIPGFTGDPFRYCNPIVQTGNYKFSYHNSNINIQIKKKKLNLFFESFEIRTNSKRALQSIPLWTKQSVSRHEQPTCLYLSTRIHWKSSRMSARMCNEFRMSIEQSLHE